MNLVKGKSIDVKSQKDCGIPSDNLKKTEKRGY